MFDYDLDRPDADLPEVDVCPEGCGLINVADQSIEASGYEEQERQYHVIWLECGHEISWPVRRQRQE
jgi:hypothetical protein